LAGLSYYVARKMVDPRKKKREKEEQRDKGSSS